MVDSKQPTAAAATTADTSSDPNLSNPPRKDHYSYSYKYKTAADPDSGVPGVNTVEVNESVTEEIGPDGSKIIRRHQQEKQVNLSFWTGEHFCHKVITVNSGLMARGLTRN